MPTLNVSREGIVRSLSDQFTSEKTVISEMLQNCRRAGATLVEFLYDATTHTLTVSDNGCGFKDFETFFMIGESGWDDMLKGQEHPFGIGAASILFACDYMKIDSNGLSLSAFTDDILNFKPIDPVPCYQTIGAKFILTLKLSRLRDEKKYLAHCPVEDAVRNLARGYPVEVLFNNERVDRPHSTNSGRTFIATPVGEISLEGLDTLEYCTGHPTVYLQAIPITMPGRYTSTTDKIIVHLDQTKFRARVPDRSVLVDSIDPDIGTIHRQNDAVNNAIRQIWRDRLVDELRAVGKMSSLSVIGKPA